ncbi:MAG: NADH-dependent [FeFe] hydrogenase, group A6 [Spirochaetota bacterium]
MATVTIDGITTAVPDGSTILDAADRAGISIPTLCHHEDLSPRGSCGMCVVDIDGTPDPKRACISAVRDGMQVRTNTARLRSARRGLLELVLAAHPADCLQCIKHGKCELQDLAERLEVRTLPYDTYTRGLSVDRTSRAIVRDMNKCIGCGRCVDVCNTVQSVGSIFFQGRGSDTIVAPAYGQGMGDSVCVNCGQCVVYCPVGALYEREDIHGVWNAIDDPARTVVAQIAPAVRVSLGEEFGMEPGTLSIGKIYAALRAIGVDVVFDTNFSADLTIMEEGTELLNRVGEGGPLPLITSCSPGWIKFGETYFPELLENVSTCKSPQQMMGAIIKTYFAETRGLDPAAITSVSIMPCTAKKFEANRPEMNSSGFRDVDYVLTTRELARMIREAGIEFERLKEEKADPVLSQYTGAATIFGATGGVMEAAVRTAYEIRTGEALPHIELEAVRGMDGVRQAAVDLAGTEVRVAVAHGLANARRLLEVVRNAKTAGELPFHFVEVMACTGGCIGGGGQPLENTIARRRQRIAGLYREDQELPIRKSHENPEVQALYQHWLGKPGGHVSHELLHTGYTERPRHAVTDLSKAAKRTMPKATPAG